MLELRAVSCHAPGDPDRLLLNKVNLRFPRGHFGAIVGPSGCGKSTLIKVISGIIAPSDGAVFWDGRDLDTEEDLPPGEIGYVPQFSIAYDDLTVAENILTAFRLRVTGLDEDQRAKRTDRLLDQVGLDGIADRRTKVLSGGQKRRLALALELVSSPSLLLCDEVTSGLDIASEDDIVQRLSIVAKRHDSVVLSVTHSLRHMALYNSVTVLYDGRVAYHGPCDKVLEHFGVWAPEDIFAALATEKSEYWEQYAFSENKQAASDKKESVVVPSPNETEMEEEQVVKDNRVADPLTQFSVLLERRLTLFWRDPSQIWLQVALVVLFPALVTLFAYQGLPDIRNLTMDMGGDFVSQAKEAIAFTAQTAKVGGLVSGLIMFQVVLLTLMASNNAAREVVSERVVFEKEKLAGLHTSSYLASKLVFLGILVLVQSLWMGLFVKFVCHFPGPMLPQLTALLMVNVGVTATCLAISSWSTSTEKASLLSIYLVGFQLPLSGAVLPLPEALGPLVRPFIASYWSWSGFVQTMKDTRFYDLIYAMTQTPLSPLSACLWVLLLHGVIGVAGAYLGCWRGRWQD